MCGHCCLEQRCSDAVAGSLFPKRRRGSHGVTVLLPQGRKQYSSSAEYPLLSVPGKGKELVRAAPQQCSWMSEACHCNCEDCTYLQRKQRVNYTELPKLFFKQVEIFGELKLLLFLLNRTELFCIYPTLSPIAEVLSNTTGQVFHNRLWIVQTSTKHTCDLWKEKSKQYFPSLSVLQLRKWRVQWKVCFPWEKRLYKAQYNQ